MEKIPYETTHPTIKTIMVGERFKVENGHEITLAGVLPPKEDGIFFVVAETTENNDILWLQYFNDLTGAHKREYSIISKVEKSNEQ